MGRDEEEQQSRGFKVQDRRRFVDEASDESRQPAPAEAAPPSAPADTPPSFSAASTSGTLLDAGSLPNAAAEEEIAGGEMSFSTFVMGLTTQALMHLGEIPDPVHQGLTHDLPAAKQMIDLLAILRDKTKGNLDAAEEQLLGDVLYDLRMRYVEVARGR